MCVINYHVNHKIILKIKIYCEEYTLSSTSDPHLYKYTPGKPGGPCCPGKPSIPGRPNSPFSPF